MRFHMLVLLLGATLSAQSPVQEKKDDRAPGAVDNPGDQRLPNGAHVGGKVLRNFLAKPGSQSLQVWRRAAPPTCSIPLKNVLRPEWRAPSRTPDAPMIRPIPPITGTESTNAWIRQVPLPAPSCDDVK